jgi:hypothetical protein
MMKRLLIFCALLSLGLGPLASSMPLAAAAPMARPKAKPGNDDKKLVIYPNPSTGIIHLTINNLEGKRVELSILNVIGSVMYRETLTELNDRYTKTLDLSKFANGLYYVKLEAESTSQMCKLVIR